MVKRKIHCFETAGCDAEVQVAAVGDIAGPLPRPDRDIGKSRLD
jgi:hypothetical protein